MHGAAVDAGRVGDPLDRAGPRGQQRAHPGGGLRGEALAPGAARELVQVVARVAGQHRIGRRDRTIEVGGAADDAVERGVELDARGRAEHATVRARVARRPVHEAHAQRPPRVAEDRADDPVQPADRQLDRLAHRDRPPGRQRLRQHDDPVDLLDPQVQRLVVQPQVTDDRLEHAAQGRRLPRDQPQGPEVRQLAVLGHPQPEVVDPRDPRRPLEQAADRRGRDQRVRIERHAARQADGREHRVGVEPERRRGRDVAVQRGAADPVLHRHRRARCGRCAA